MYAPWLFVWRWYLSENSLFIWIESLFTLQLERPEPGFTSDFRSLHPEDSGSGWVCCYLCSCKRQRDETVLSGAWAASMRSCKGLNGCLVAAGGAAPCSRREVFSHRALPAPGNGDSEEASDQGRSFKRKKTKKRKSVSTSAFSLKQILKNEKLGTDGSRVLKWLISFRRKMIGCRLKVAANSKKDFTLRLYKVSNILYVMKIYLLQFNGSNQGFSMLKPKPVWSSLILLISCVSAETDKPTSRVIKLQTKNTSGLQFHDFHQSVCQKGKQKVLLLVLSSLCGGCYQ